ncbi:MAG: galactokinase [Acidimicrobiia bacterium]
MPDVQSGFAGRYGRAPEVAWWAPGRVNLIGEHTDYNGGQVLPVAIRQGVACAAAARADGCLRVASVQERGGPVVVDLDDLAPGIVSGWVAYPAGVAWALREAGQPVGGADVLVDGEVPAGAGLASSAALAVSVAAALSDLVGGGDLAESAPLELARLAQRAEQVFAGVPCGLMDQAVAVLAREGHALWLDCGGPAWEWAPFDPAAAGLALFGFDTGTRHRLAEGAYAARRADCERAAAALGVGALAEIGMADLDGALARLGDERLRRRVRHVVSENARVEAAVAALHAGEPSRLGALLDGSHSSLRDDFEVSTPELDLAAATAREAGALGARLTGGGFGGTVLALVPAAMAGSVGEAVQHAFRRKGFPPLRTFPVEPGPGAHRLGGVCI